MRTPHARPRLVLLALLCLPLAACGVAESIAERFVDDEEVSVDARPDRSASFVRLPDGTDTEVLPDTYLAGDDAAGRHVITLLGFPLGQGTQLPANTEIDNATLHVYVGVDGGTPDELAPMILSHLPSHPDVVPTPGLVPDPPGADLGQLTAPIQPGWHTFDVTQQLIEDLTGGKTISAYVLRLAQESDGDLVADRYVLVEPATGARARLVVRLSLDL